MMRNARGWDPSKRTPCKIEMRHPGIEPGPPRWQRGIITTRLMTLWLGSEAGRWHSGRPGLDGGSAIAKTVSDGCNTPY
jgi:hypothetical protein